MITVAVINLTEINYYFIIPATILLFLAFIFFLYARKVMLGCKQLLLQKKSPIFHFYSESINGLTQIGVFNRRKSQIKKFS